MRARREREGERAVREGVVNERGGLERVVEEGERVRERGVRERVQREHHDNKSVRDPYAIADQSIVWL